MNEPTRHHPRDIMARPIPMEPGCTVDVRYVGQRWLTLREANRLAQRLETLDRCAPQLIKAAQAAHELLVTLHATQTELPPLVDEDKLVDVGRALEDALVGLASVEGRADE